MDASEDLSIREQCHLLGLPRSTLYYEGRSETPENLAIMRRLDELSVEHPVYGSRKLMVMLQREGISVNRKRVVRLMRLMGIEAIHPRVKTSQPAAGKLKLTQQLFQFSSWRTRSKCKPCGPRGTNS